MRTIDEISWGEKVLVSFKYSTCTTGFPPWSTTLNGHVSMSFFTVGSSNLRPISRLARSALLSACRSTFEMSNRHTWYQIWYWRDSWQPGSWPPRQLTVLRQWKKRMKALWSFLAHWQLTQTINTQNSPLWKHLQFLTYWFRHWFLHNWQHMNR